MSRRFLLTECRDALAEDLDAVLRSECLLRDGKPDRSTLTPELLPYVRARDLLIQRLDAAVNHDSPALIRRPTPRGRA